MAQDNRRPALMTVDLEDYRRQELRDHLGTDPSPNPKEVDRQINLLLAALEAIEAEATFFSVGRLGTELSKDAFRRIAERHRIGCHGYEHLRVSEMGAHAFRKDLIRAKKTLEDIVSRPVVSFRAPYFSADGCDPWFGQTLSEEGFLFDSSRRLHRIDSAQGGAIPLEGSGGKTVVVPLYGVGFGQKRVTVIGGTYLRLLSIDVVKRLLKEAERCGFVPMVYLHPYDLDAYVPPLSYPRRGYLIPKLGDRLRRTGRRGVVAKLRALSEIYTFRSIETHFDGRGSAACTS